MTPAATAPEGATVVVHRGLRPLPEDRRVEEARAQLSIARRNTHQAFEAFHHQIAEQTDWRTWYKRHPGTFLTMGFLAGFLLAGRR